jgi:hypothetical protein
MDSFFHAQNFEEKLLNFLFSEELIKIIKNMFFGSKIKFSALTLGSVFSKTKKMMLFLMLLLLLLLLFVIDAAVAVAVIFAVAVAVVVAVAVA